MYTSILSAFAEALGNLRTNFFQTFLSVLGIIIGVAALVAMLAIIDGLEKVAREGVAENSSLESVLVQAKTSREVDGLRVPLDEIATLDRGVVDSMLRALPFPAAGQLYTAGTTLAARLDTTEELAVRYMAASLPFAEEAPDIIHGRPLASSDEVNAEPSVIVNDVLARRLIGPSDSLAFALRKPVNLFGGQVVVAGIYSAGGNDKTMQLIAPLNVLDGLPDAPDASLLALVNFDRVEDVTPGREFMIDWFGERFPEIDEPVVASANLDMVKQLETGFTVFRLVMGFLIGIAVVVGGVGVMNVLLMSITERTAEIGVRKAVGANPRRIMTQFLSESVAVSTIGSFFGLLLGGLGAVAVAAVISFRLDVEFNAVFSLRTLLIVFAVAVVTGIVFGTYPARRASRLDPVAAIQRT